MYYMIPKGFIGAVVFWLVECAINWQRGFDNMSIFTSRDIFRELMSFRHLSAFENTAY